MKSCPFCGGRDLFVERADSSSCFVQCACNARGPIGVQESDDEGLLPGEVAAIAAWNSRTSEHEQPHIAALLRGAEHSKVYDSALADAITRTAQSIVRALMRATGMEPPTQAVDVDDDQPIELTKEDPEELRKYGLGLDQILENCIFCKNPTTYWHVPTNTPCCPDCAKLYKVRDIKKAKNA